MLQSLLKLKWPEGAFVCCIVAHRSDTFWKYFHSGRKMETLMLPVLFHPLIDFQVKFIFCAVLNVSGRSLGVCQNSQKAIWIFSACSCRTVLNPYWHIPFLLNPLSAEYMLNRKQHCSWTISNPKLPMSTISLRATELFILRYIWISSSNDEKSHFIVHLGWTPEQKI